MTMRRVPEKVVQAQVVRLLSSLGGLVYTVGTRRPRGDYQGTCQTPGLPDLMAFVPNPQNRGSFILLFIECKADGGRPSPAQRAFREHCIAAGQAHVLGGVDTVIEWLLSAGILKAANVPHYRLPGGVQVKESPHAD